MAPSAYPSGAANPSNPNENQNHQPREFVPDVPSAYHGSMMGLPPANHPMPLFGGQNCDPVYGNIEDLYDEDEIQPMITND